MPTAGDVVLGLLLPVRHDLYALPVDGVQQVLDLDATIALTPLPGSAAVVLGLVNVRGQVIPVLDTAALLDLPPLGPEEQAALAVVRLQRGVAALVTTATPRTERLGEDLGPSALATGTRRHRVGRHVGTLLDLEATLAPERLA